jgi:hypothetical protein
MQNVCDICSFINAYFIHQHIYSCAKHVSTHVIHECKWDNMNRTYLLLELLLEEIFFF